MEDVHSSETAVNVYQTTRCYIPEDNTVHRDSSEPEISHKHSTSCQDSLLNIRNLPVKFPGFNFSNFFFSNRGFHFICLFWNVFNNAFSIHKLWSVECEISNELRRMCKKAIVAYIKVLSRRIHRQTEDNHDPLRLPRWDPKVEPGNFEDDAETFYGFVWITREQACF
jgi:hypothetical protein